MTVRHGCDTALLAPPPPRTLASPLPSHPNPLGPLMIAPHNLALDYAYLIDTYLLDVPVTMVDNTNAASHDVMGPLCGSLS